MSEISEKIKRYFAYVDKKLKEAYEAAGKAREKGYDPENKVEIPLARDMAERVEGLISVVAPQIKGKGLSQRIKELELQYGSQNWKIAFFVSEEVANEKFCKFKDKREAMEVGLRVGLAYITNGVVSSPLEGFVKLELKKRLDDGKEYFCLYFGGPIRSAGTTATCIFLAVADFVRIKMGYAAYDPTEEEVNRTFSELEHFHDRITNLQYFPSKKEADFITKHLPIQIDGDPSEKLDVPNYKNLQRVGTNKLRNGFCLVMAEGLCQKFAKFWGKFSKWNKELEMDHWSFLEEFVNLQKEVRAKGKAKQVSKARIVPDFNYIKDLVAGRPVLGHPLNVGAFRVRLGRGRTTGLSDTAIHPATMVILDGFIAYGTQLKTERPGKSTVVSSCDSIEGPVVKLKNGDVEFIETEERAREIVKDVQEIIFAGDILVNYGYFLNRVHVLAPVGYCLPHHEKIFILKNGLWQNVEIGELINSLNKDSFRKHDNITWFDNSEDIKILALNPETYEAQAVNIKKFMIKKSKENYLKIKLEDGRIINVSQDHPLMILTNSGLEKIKAKNVTKGSYLLCLKALELGNSISKFDLKSVLIALGYELKQNKDNPNLFKIKKNKVYLPKTININNKLGRILGYYAAEGYSTKKGKSPRVVFSFGKHETDLVDELSLLIFDIFGVKPTVCEEKTALNVYLYGKIFSIIFEDIFLTGNNAYTKVVPKIIINTNPEIISNYLDAYFLGDGIFSPNSADNSCLEVCTQSMSKNLVADIHYLLLTLKIASTLRFDSIRNVYCLRIQSGENILRFIKNCGSGINLRNLKHLANTIYKPLSEKYPNFYFDLKNAKNWEERSIIKHAINRNGKIGKSLSLVCQSEEILKLRESVVHPYQIIDIQEVKYDGNFYNIELDKHHIFMHGNGVFTHNCEEWWALELEKALGENKKEYMDLIINANKTKISFNEAYKISKETGVSLHPRFTYHWNDLTPEQFKSLIEWLEFAVVKKEKIIIPLTPGDNKKRTLELIGIPHKHVNNEYVVIEEEWAEAFRSSLGFYTKELDKNRILNEIKEELSIIDIINRVSEVKLRDKSGLFIGSRMGRPEKAKMRKLTGSPQSLFPVGKEGGRLRCFQAALEKGKVTAEFTNYHCEKCSKDTVYRKCHLCGEEAKKTYHCRECKETDGKCGHEKVEAYKTSELDIKEHFDLALKKLGTRNYPELIKGVRGTSNKEHIPEHLVKGILRAVNDIYVNKDGTTRYDMTEQTLTHFKPKEIGTSLEKLKELGYTHDIYGNELINDSQILEIKCQDLVLPSCPESTDEGADYVLFRVAKFIDDLLEKLYEQERFYNLQKREDLVGHLVVGLSPHTAAGIVGRIIGFSKTQAMLANPLFHSIMRRDADGDEACVMLLMDALLNFSPKLLSNHRGATQDEPLVLSSMIIPSEVDDMIFDMDITFSYPLELYEACSEYKSASEIKIRTLKNELGKEGQYEGWGFTHDTEDLNNGVRCSSYKILPTMQEKVEKQMILCEKLRAVDVDDVARLIIERHFIRDIKGNLSKFSRQQFRCVGCNAKFRRPPLKGSCSKCNGRIIFTISEGSIMKYLQPSMSLAEKYKIPPYLKQTLDLAKQMVEMVFGKDKEKQEALGKWFG